MLDSLKQEGQSKNWVTAGFLLVILFLLLPIPVDNIKYIAASFLVTGYAVYGLFNKNYKLQFRNSKVFFALAAFVTLSFLSTIWASDTSMAIRESFIWLLFSLIALSINSLISVDDHFDYHLSKMFSIFFMLFLIFHLGAIQFEIGLSADWNALMSKNKEYTTTLLTCLSPFILFYPSKSQFVRFLKVISIVLLANLLFLTAARGALLAFSMILLLKYWNFYAEWKYRFFGVLLGAIIIVSGIYVLNTSTISSELLFVKEYRAELASRILMNKNSIASISEQPIVGVGAGQWYNDIYRHGVGQTDPLSSTNIFVRYRSHNLYFKQLVEVGIVGFILFFGCLTGILWKYRHRWTELSGYQKASWACLLSYLIVVYFYANAVPYEYFFSSITLVAFVSLGILIGGLDSRNFKFKMLPYLVLILSLSTSAWYIYSKQIDDNHRIVLASEGNDTIAIEALERTYHPILHSSYNYNTSISQLLAERFAKIGDNTKAAAYYTQALKQRPFHEPLLRSYVDFCIISGMNKDVYEQYFDTLMKIHPDFTANQQLLQRLKER